MLSDLFKHSGIYFGGLTISRLLSTFVFILFARTLNPSSFGDLVLFHTLVLTITFFSDFGMNQWYQKMAHQENKDKLFGKIIHARIFTLISSLFLSFLFLYLTRSFSTSISLIFLIVLVFEAFSSIVDGYYLEKKQAGKLSLKTAARMIVYLAGYILTFQVFTFEVAVYLYLISSFVTAAWIFPWGQLKHLQFSPLSRIMKTLKGSSSYAFLIATSFAYSRGDSLVVRYTLNSSALGIYGAAYRYLEGLSLLPTALSHNLFPLSAKESTVTSQHLRKITLFMMLIGLLTSIVLYVFSDWFIVTIIGPAYIQAVPILKIFSGVVFLFFLNAPLATIVQSSKLLKKFLPFGIANTVLNIALNILLIPFFGVVAAAWVMLTTEITGLLVNLYFTRKLYNQ
ncbi:hypothetical protein A3G67_03035 [Candidatus Roizmanbacteria bacterium RIFCSPLOWO2_12_FULL_40_12]|uniref:Uncharacterized protein n=1 Tax=Candidatus Roizmanbacteria bacterium RIFCSPLOWO2_01_FULL_40_42 TaxID=1802066 RepID=A0A1F7J5A6_9BACT|nr:MAG: hypothetical protein A2779_02670 [Candidatus Roizmanbacteria bacterium RIFCSPHIGHO2_01_FULL_40_98]OGK28248.1 MAG: hypothetical protein A3C31_00035 [Candidatus Roizmanbacteria bacterium RIFCSPHIGHO2_02_FULL_40_53]OGK30484.1 MAG: hypothetical protein A2W49_02720 [Candidatus Roizmanbacteria bacterium RIFCSPHIGHO2_12_41_18]OGK36898.1 MAG: hypothetical protein A3E69_00295 [Candidatus Roizmanbacteria bacterium RIFCSPHIGHO2_12_FULL_40_130]OGK50804.1 MAG: hypothetical protein A3B50_00805 [Candi